MTLLIALLAGLLHLILMPVAALLLAGFEAKLRARLVGAGGPALLLTPRALLRLLRKQRVRSEQASVLAGLAPPAALAATLAALCLLPSFTPDLPFPAAGDLLVVAGLLVLGRLLACLAAGAIAPGAALVAEPALLLAVFLRILPGGGAAAPLGMAALALAAGVLATGPAPATTASGADLALLELAGRLRRLAFFALLAGQVLPALPPGPEWWPVGLAAWAVAIALLASGLAVAETISPPWRPARRREALAAGLVLGVLAVLVGLAEFAP